MSDPVTLDHTKAVSLLYYARVIPERSQQVAVGLPQLWAVAEAIHLGFHAVLAPFDLSDLADPSLVDSAYFRWRLIQMAHLDWVYAWMLVSSGQRNMATMLVRRSIEYIAYAAKINSGKDVKTYCSHLETPEKRAEFSSQFSIPRSFRSEQKYGFLWNLLGYWDIASEVGIHANWETATFRELDATKISHFDDPKFAETSIYLAVQIGIWLLEASESILKSFRSGSYSDRQFDDIRSALDVIKAQSPINEEPHKTWLQQLLGENPQEAGISRFGRVIEALKIQEEKRAKGKADLEEARLEIEDLKRQISASGRGRNLAQQPNHDGGAVQ